MSIHQPISELMARGEVVATHLTGIANPTIEGPMVEMVGRKKGGHYRFNTAPIQLEPEKSDVGGFLKSSWRKIKGMFGEGTTREGHKPGNNDHRRHRGEGANR